MNLDRLEKFHPEWVDELGLLSLALDHGKANEMGSEQLALWAEVCELVETTPSVRSLCVRSSKRMESGRQVFISGANVSERVGWPDARIIDHVTRQRELMVRLRKLPMFTMAVVSGVAFGWGLEFVLAMDYCIATPEASFAAPETGLGIVPGARGTAELGGVVGLGHALRIGCTGEVVDAREAARIGLIHECLSEESETIARVRVLAAGVASRSPSAVAAFKHAVMASVGLCEAERLAVEKQAYEQCVSSGEAARGRENFAAIRKGQPPSWAPRTPAPQSK